MPSRTSFLTEKVKIDSSLANGQIQRMKTFAAAQLSPEGILEISAETLRESPPTLAVNLIDVRRPEEYNAELGHLAHARLVPLGPELAQALREWNPAETYVFICRSGVRSVTAALHATSAGFTNVYNLQGGMVRWNHLGFPVERDGPR